jgi:hypothetical protein
VVPAVENAHPNPLFIRDARQEPCPIDSRASDLDVGRARAAQRTAAEQSASYVGGSTARPRDDATRWVLDRRKTGAQHTCFVEYLKGMFVRGDVELVSSGAFERTGSVRPEL